MNTVIYHSADYDGIFCREIAKLCLPSNTHLIGWSYGEPIPIVPEENLLYILDLSIDELMNRPNLIWIDHHKTAIEKYNSSIVGYRIDGVAACRLAWQWFTSGKSTIPTKQDFIDRLVTEPLSVRLAGEYDIWDKRDPDAELFQHGLRSCDLDWSRMFDSSLYVKELLNNGKAVAYAKEKENESIATKQSFDILFEGYNFIAINAARFNSHVFKAAVKDYHDGCLGFNFNGKEWNVSMYGVQHKKNLDFTPIAKKYGGGGHAQACGFRSKSLPFLCQS